MAHRALGCYPWREGAEVTTVVGCAAGTGPGIVVADKGAEIDHEGRRASDGPYCATARIGGWPAVTIIGCEADADGANWATVAA